MKQGMFRNTFYALGIASLFLTACQKNNTSLSSAGVTSTDATTATSSTIAVVASASVATADSVYIVQPCQRGAHRDSIAQTDLPATVSSYLNANYVGYTFHKAFSIKDSTGTLVGYAVVIYYNDKPVGLEFDNTGAFVKVLEQRGGGDLNGRGFHHGGRFGNRDGKGADSVNLSALPPAITIYFNANYSSDTLLKAYKNSDSGYTVISKNNGLFATVFGVDGQFVKRTSLAPATNRAHWHTENIAQAALPAAVTTYLIATYPDYVFDKAFVVTENSTVQGYVVVIDANNTRYATAFDAAGGFIAAKTIY